MARCCSAKLAAAPAHQGSYLRDRLAGANVGQFFKPTAAVPILKPNDSLRSIFGKLGDNAYSVLPVVDGGGLLIGVVNLEEIYFADQLDPLHAAIVTEDLVCSDVTPLAPDDPLDGKPR